MGDGADKQLRQQQRDTRERNRALRAAVTQQGAEQRAALARFYEHQREQGRR